jgi:RHS repeat-associated protein
MGYALENGAGDFRKGKLWWQRAWNFWDDGTVVEVRGADGRVWRQFIYGTTNGFMNMYKGKLARQVANNSFDPNNPSANFQVVEDFTYGGIGGRVSSKTTQAGVVGGYVGTFTQSFGWTELGDLAWESYPQKAGVGPSRVVRYTYRGGYLTAVQEGSVTYASLSYHPSGMVARRQRGNGTREEVLADPSGMARVGNIQVYGPGGSLLWQTGSYAYDGAGNVKAIGGDRYWYDKVSRLVGAQVGGRSFAASYNAFGFMTGMAKDGVWQTFVADGGGATNRISGASYDGAGQVTGFAGRVLGWYPTGQLRSVGWSGQALTFGYDASGERVGYHDSVESGIRYTLRGLFGQVLREYFELNGSWSWVKDHVWAGGELIATVEPTGTKHLHRDHLGSVRVETGSNGALLTTHSYWPFGEEMTVTSSSERYRFAGHERDQRTGYDYMHARYYAPMAGRFFSPDPVRGDSAQPQSLNLFAYVTDNPLNLVDPWGLAAEAAMPPSPTIAESQRDGVCSGVSSDADCPRFHEAVEGTGRGSGGRSLDLGAYSSTQDLKNYYAWLAMQNLAAFSGSTFTAYGFWRYAVRNANEDPMLQVLASITGVILPSERTLVKEFDAAYENWFANPQLGFGEDSRYGRLWGPLGNAVWFVTLGQSGSSCVGWTTGLYSALAPLTSDRARPVLTERRLLSFILIHTFATLELRRGAGWVTVRRYDPFWRLR